MARRLRIGLTGGIASGKSAVSNRFRALSIPVIDADDAARAVVVPGSRGLIEVARRFGPHILLANQELDRRALRRLIFADPSSRRDLEVILHPLIRAEMDRRETLVSGVYVVLEIPLLIESNAVDRVDRILVVDVDETNQLARITARDGGSKEQARAVLAAQATRQERLQHADDVIENVGTITELNAAVDRLHRTYLDLAQKRAGLT